MQSCAFLAMGVHTLRPAKFTQPLLDPILTVWSIGAEKLLKLPSGTGS
jgi:hypothetical protein